MRLNRLYVQGPLRPGQQHSLTANAVNHVTRVLRLRVGDALTLFDGSGGEYPAIIDKVRRDEVWVNIREHNALEHESPLQLTLAQGISRGERMDWVVQKATELGAASIVPLFTERSVVQLDAQQAQRKVQHWRSIAVGACEQSGRNHIPDIALPSTLHAFLDGPPQQGATRLLLSPRASRRLAELLAPGSAVTVLIGPEGGLSDIEQEAAAGRGFMPVSLGPRILRTETAAVVALALLQQQFGDL